MGIYTREKLNALGIFEIRSVARAVGVKSPTSLKKESAIEEILKITSGQTQPHIRQNNKGRPPREIGSVKSFVDVFLPVQKTGAFGKGNAFLDALNVASGNEFAGGQTRDITGLVEIMPEGYGFLYTKDFAVSNVFVSEGLIDKYGICTGDEVTAQCRQISDDGKMAARTVVEINGIGVSDYCSAKEKTKNQGVEKPNGNVAGLANVKRGDKVAVLGAGVDLQEKIVKMFNECKDDKLLINSNSLEENYITHTSAININKFEEDSAIERRIWLITNHYLNKATLGQNFVIFITDVTFLPKAISAQKTLDASVDSDALKKTKMLFANGKKFNGGGSLTIVAGLNKNAFNANIINSELCEIANQII